MAASTRINCLALATLFAGLGVAENRLTLQQVNQRNRGSFAPSHLNQTATVGGVVSSKAIDFRNYTHLFIQDDAGYGVAIEGRRGEFQEFSPGDVLEVAGEVSHRGGLPVVKPTRVTKLRTVSAPLPQKFEVASLRDPEKLGRLVTLETYVATSFENSGGDEIRVGSGPAGQIAIFLPREAHRGGNGLHELRPGDKVRVTGITAQYTLSEPFNRNFEVIVDRAENVVVLARGWFLRPDTVAYGGALLLFGAITWWLRERSMAMQRRVLRSMTRLSEYVIAAHSPREIAQRLESALPDLISSLTVDLYLLNEGTGMLERVTTDANPEPSTIRVDEQLGTFTSVVALCHRNSALLHVPDTHRSPLFDTTLEETARAATFVPLLTQRQTLGVFAVQFRGGVRRVGSDQLAAMQHLGNQIAASLRLQEQQSMREQLLRSERMAASGQLISGVATDLRAPLQSILNLTGTMLARKPGPLPETELREIAFEAGRGADLIAHLLSFSGTEHAEPSSVNINALVNDIVDLRARDWQMKSITAENGIPVLPIFVLADQSQLEQVFLNLIVQAEQALDSSTGKRISVTSRLIGAKVQVGIDVSGTSPQGPSPLLTSAGDSFGWKVSQAIIETHRGELRSICTTGGFRTEVDLPLYQPNTPSPEPAEGRDVEGARMLMAIVVEPDLSSHRRLLLLLSARGHRVVPVESAEEAAEMVQRMRFDLLFASSRLSGLNWVALFHRVRRRVGCFVLLNDGFDPEAVRTLQPSDGQTLSKPVEEQDLDRILATLTSAPART